MSVQFVDKVRFELNEIDSMFSSLGLNSSSTKTSTNLSSSTSSDTPNMFTSSKLNEKNLKCLPNSTTPKVPSNLVKSPAPSTNSDLMLYDRQQLTEFLAERQDRLLKTRSEYDLQFENFFSLAKKFHLEKLNNLKLTFKNQILKQQIYFETEMLDLCKEYNRDYHECSSKTKLHSNTKRSVSKYEPEKSLVRQFKMDMKKLLEYMRESLINSSDTLIEAYETCRTLKSLEHVENNFQKQNNQMKSTTNALMKSVNKNHKLNDRHDDESDEQESLDKQLNEEQQQFEKYKQEMDELMHILDDIELQHLQRKDQLATKVKFCNKLKTKFKFIETKYETLSKQITNLKHESSVYKELWNEKKRTDLVNSLNSSCALLFNSAHSKHNITNQNSSNTSSSTTETSENSYSEFNSCSKSSAGLSLSPSSLSKSSSTSSLSDCVADLISSSNEANSNTTNESSSSTSSSHSSKSTTSSSSSSLCNQDLSDMLAGSNQLDYENDSNDSDEHNKDDNRNYLSLADYNRKLSLINELINLHKSKMSSKDLWSMSSSSCTQSAANTNFIKANMRGFDLKEDDLEDDDKLANYTILNDENENELTSCIRLLKQASSLELTDCSTDGDRVIVENCNLKLDRDISNWYLTRQIENMSISKFKLPNGSVIKSGKVLKIETPFANDQLDYLIAIKNQLKREQQQQQHQQQNLLQSSAKCQVKKLCLKIRTKLLSPDGTLRAIHIQEIPQFYQDIFKYANMIQFL